MPEELSDELNEAALDAVKESSERAEPQWVRWAALSTMVMALFSALGGMLAGKTANEAIIARQMQLSELVRLNRAELQSDVLLTRPIVMESMGKKIPEELRERAAKAGKEADKHLDEAIEDVGDSRDAFEAHEVLALGTTILSTAISLIGMAVIVQGRKLWLCGLAVGGIGATIVVISAIHECMGLNLTLLRNRGQTVKSGRHR